MMRLPRPSWLHLVLLLTSLLWSDAASAHEDLPGPPVLEVRTFIDDGLLLPFKGVSPINAYFEGGDWEFELWSVFEVDDHPHANQQITTLKEISSTSQDYTLPFSSIVFRHDECSPKSQVKVRCRLRELDLEELEKVGLSVSASATGMIIRYRLKGIVVTGSVLLGGALIALIGALNGVDDFGATSEPEAIPTNGVLTMTLRGEDGHARVSFRDETTETSPKPGIDCLPPVVNGAFIVPSEGTNRVFDNLEDAFRFIEQIKAERSNPARLNEKKVQDVQKSLGSLVLRAGQIAAAFAIREAAPFVGTQAAIDAYLEGENAALGGDSAGALEKYRLAYRVALGAIFEGMEAMVPTYGPTELIPITSTLATTPRKKPTITGYLFGREPGELIEVAMLEDLPAGAVAQEPILDNERGTVSFELDLHAVQPGTYMITAKALLVGANASSTLSAPLELIVHGPCDPNIDADGDGASECDDCDDQHAMRGPDREEICSDVIDNDCDGRINQGCLGGPCDASLPCGEGLICQIETCAEAMPAEDMGADMPPAEDMAFAQDMSGQHDMPSSAPDLRSDLGRDMPTEPAPEAPTTGAQGSCAQAPARGPRAPAALLVALCSWAITRRGRSRDAGDSPRNQTHLNR